MPTARSPGKGVARLVYEDEAILAYDKPVGLPVIAPEGSRARCLLDIATERIARKNPKGRAAVVHRIDRDTSGIVIFAVDGKTKKILMDGWDELVAQRLYIALVVGSMPEQSGIFDSWLKENKAGEVYRALPKEKGAKRAVTHWRVLGAGRNLSLLELALETGRKHQIRVQLADSGHPVLGDEKYGHGNARGEGVDLGRLCLHACAIELKLPGRDALRIESPPPPEFSAAISQSIESADSRRDGRATAAPINGRSDGASASRIGARSDSRPGRDAPRGK
jgi:23S rRNA pseudouridine1911/1915/1917 synthase